MASSLTKLRKARKLPEVKPNPHDYFKDTAPPKARDLEKYAEAQGWTKQQTPNGPPKYLDDNGVNP